MSRLSEALRRAGQADDRQSSPEGDEEQFTAGEDGQDELDDQEPEPELQPAAIGAIARERVPDITHLVPRPRALRGAPAMSERPDDIQIRDVIQVVMRRKWLICAVIVAALGVAAGYNRLAKPVYQARARVLVERDLAQVMPFRSVTDDTMGVEYFVTQFDVLRSRGLARRTLEQMNVLNGDPTAQSSQINQFLGALNVSPVKSDLGPSRVINVAVNSERPELAAQLANAHAQAYVQQNLAQRRSGNQEASKWLNERLAELRQEMTKAAGALQQYRENKDALSLEGGQNIVGQKLAQLNMTLTTIRAEKLQKEAIYQQLKAIQESGAPLDTFPPILANGYIQGLKQDLSTQQRERGRLSEQFGEQHPEMIKISATIASTERKLNEEMNKVVQSVFSDFKATEAQESALARALDDQKREVLALDQKSIVYGGLERDAKSSQQIFDSVLQRLKETELSGELQTNNVRILDAAETPRVPISPRTSFNLALAFAIGCVLAAALVTGLEYLHPRITRPQEIRDSLGLPVLGITPKVSVWKGALKVDRLPPAFQEAMRGVRTTLLLSGRTPIPRTLAVTSTTVGEGKTAVASSLAVSMAAAGRRVLLVDADMRRSQVHRMFNVPLSPGLSDILAGDAKPSEALLESHVSGLFILPGGTSKAANSELLDSERLTHLIRGFSQVFDLVLLDCPPVMAVADASIIANAASGVVFVVGSGVTSREAAQAAVDRLTSVQARVVGVILNKAKSDRPGYANPYYYQTQDIA